MKIYCLINIGSSFNDEIADFIFDSAQQMLSHKDNKMRIRLLHRKLRGEIRTSYKVGFMGAVAGIVCSATLDWDEGTAATDFIVRPTKSRDEVTGLKWQPAPLFPKTNPKLN